MSKQADYEGMSEADLRAYVLQNPSNNEAFHAYVDRVNQENPNRIPMSADDALAEIKKRVSSQSS
jgi:hypothetical protein